MTNEIIIMRELNSLTLVSSWFRNNFSDNELLPIVLSCCNCGSSRSSTVAKYIEKNLLGVRHPLNGRPNTIYEYSGIGYNKLEFEISQRKVIPIFEGNKLTPQPPVDALIICQFTKYFGSKFGSYDRLVREIKKMIPVLILTGGEGDFAIMEIRPN